MVLLEMWQKKQWLLLHKRRLKWQEKHPGKFLPTKDPLEYQISRYTCALCGERRYYRTNGLDKDIPQYHQVGKRWLVLCHACWHLKGIYKKHQNARSLEGISGCRFCHLQLEAKRARKRSQAHKKQENSIDQVGPRKAEFGTTDWEPARIRSSNGVPAGRVSRRNVPGGGLARRGTG